MTRWPVEPLTFSKKNPSRAIPRSTYIHPPSLAKIGQRTSEEIGNKQTDRQTDKRCSIYSMIINSLINTDIQFHTKFCGFGDISFIRTGYSDQAGTKCWKEVFFLFLFGDSFTMIILSDYRQYITSMWSALNWCAPKMITHISKFHQMPMNIHWDNWKYKVYSKLRV